jgi:trimeric autotransporter adhesin
MWSAPLKISLIACLAVLPLFASEYRGVVKFGGLPLPGATVTATHGEQKLVAITDPQGVYSFADLADGVWTVEVDMLCFAASKQEITVSKDAPATEWDLKLLPIEEIKASAGPAAPPAPTVSAAAPPPAPAENAKGKRNAKPAPAAPANAPSGFQRTDVNASATPAASSDAPVSDTFANASQGELNQRASDGFLINGTANNAASSPFAQANAFGNNRRGFRPLYSGSLGVIVDNSALDGSPYSLTGQDTPKPSYNRLTGIASFGGPLKIPHLFDNGGLFAINYQWTRNGTATTTPGLMPTAAERTGDLSQLPGVILDPDNGAPFAGNIIPQSRLSAQAINLLNLYPLPNFSGSSRYNYQIPLDSAMHQDALQARYNKTIGRKDQISGQFAFQSNRTDNPSVFNFLDTVDTFGLNTSVNWRRTLTSRLFGNLGFQYSRQSVRTISNFENRENVSGQAGITGNNQDPQNWGPPSLVFSSGVAGLSDAQSSFNRNQTSAVSYSLLWSHSPHTVTFGGDSRRQQFNYLGQQNPRGTFTFDGAATGSDVADFLLGVPDTSQIAFGNADKYFRSGMYDAYANDDWRISPELTVNWGLRWEYGSPITEKYDRLVNLDVAPGFTAVAPVVASNPEGSLTGQKYPDSLIRPDRHDVAPRVALAWRPISGSSMVVRAGYGVYYNTSVYQNIAGQMAQQSPLSKSLTVSNSAADPLTLANGFNASPSITPNTFAVNPNLQVGYAQNWQASVQRDLPGSLVMTATYLGIKGTRGMQEFLPNTYPVGAPNPCLTCPTGFIYLTSNGNSTREAGQFQLRRRLHSGFTATLQYTYSKSIDDVAVLGGSAQVGVQNGSGASGAAQGSAAAAASRQSTVIGQNWLDLSAERGLSSFDQRNLASVQMQYTTGMGLVGGTLVGGWRGALLKEWTFSTQVTAGTGLPLTPVYLVADSGTGVTGSIRPDYTGASLYSAPTGLSLNPAAFTAPTPGQWGNAGRDSITGPAQFTFNASMARTFRAGDRMSLDLRVDSTNALNHVTYTSWYTTINSSQFGLPVSANTMRSLQTTLRLRF